MLTQTAASYVADRAGHGHLSLGVAVLALVAAILAGAATTPARSGFDWVAFGTLILAVATIALAVSSVFQEPLARRLRKAKLRISISMEPPDTQWTTAVTQVGNQRAIERRVYMRARVTHEGGPSAENVELVAQTVWQETDSGWSVRTSVLPMSLIWSHVGTIANRIPADLFRHCDIGHFGQHGQETAFTLETQVQPYPDAAGAWPSVLPAGTYAIALLLTGDNVKPLLTTWRLSFPPEWSGSEEEMLASMAMVQIPAIPD
jgi:hypothetical protein